MPNLKTTCSLLLFLGWGASTASAQATLDGSLDCYEQLLCDRIEHELDVSVVDASGAPIQLFSESSAGLLSTDLPGHWPQRARLYVVPVAQDALTGAQRNLRMSGKTVAPGRAVFQLDGVEDYIAVLLSPGAPATTARFSWKPGSPTKQLSMRAPAPGAMGKVTVDVQNPTGGRFHQLVSFAIHDGDSGIPLIEQESRTFAPGDEEWPRAFDLPVGDYVLLARAEPVRFGHGRVRSGRKYGAARVPFSVREGTGEAVVARLTVPAFLDVIVKGAVTAADVARVEHGLERRGMVMLGGATADVAAHARLRLMREHAYPMPVEFIRYTAGGTSAAGPHLVPWIELGAQATSSALPAGRYTLHASLPGGRSVSREVELKSGETLDVQVDFSERD